MGVEDNESILNKGLKLLEKEEYIDAFRCLLPLAEKGNPEAQANIGLMYQMGVGIDRDIRSAVKWLSVAAENGRGDAAHNLGTLYLTCEPELPISQEKSKYWYNKAKELGFVVAPDDWYDK